MTLRLCIVVPVYEHAAGARALVADLARLGIETILVNDGSGPDCTEVLEELAVGNAWLQVIARPVNGGKGAAVLTGLRAAADRGFTHALQIDADGQHDVADIPRFRDLAARHTDAVIVGQPIFDASIPKGRLIGRYITHVWVWIETLSFRIKDSMCGFRVYPLADVLAIADRVRLGTRMDFDPEILVRLFWRGVPFVALPTRVHYPQDGVSHFRMFHDNALISRMHCRLVLGMLWRLPVLMSRNVFGGSGRKAGHWASLQERGGYWVLSFMLMTYRVFGRAVFSAILRVVISYYFVFNARARRASLDYLRRVRAVDAAALGPAEGSLLRPSFSHFVSFGEAILDKLRAWNDEIAEDDLVFDNLEAVDAILASGRGALMITSHLGNAEVCRALGTRLKGHRINVLVHTRHAEAFNRLLSNDARAAGLNLIQTTEVGPETAILLRQKVDAGELVVIVGDRVPVSDAPRILRVPFLGAPAPFPQGPYILASLLKCPVLLLFCVRQGRRFRISFEPFADRVRLDRTRREEAMREMALRFAERLEAHCLRSPLQWFNFFDFWNQGGHIDR
ncbi:MAG: glycosyltransferase [Thalassobaculaceae bacterium]|nr:glycosyltransferase [Thalassobaculaceae bacterium]